MFLPIRLARRLRNLTGKKIVGKVRRQKPEKGSE
jgi:hypothetical protein